MVNDNGNQFSNVFNNIPDGKKRKLFVISYLERKKLGAAPIRFFCGNR